MLPTIDTHDLPLVRISYPVLLTEVDVQEYASRLGHLLAQSCIGTVVDIRLLDPNAVGAADRQYLAAAMDATTRAHPNKLIAEAIVMDSAILRGLYTAYCWIRKDTSYRSRAFGDPAEAEVWVLSELESQGFT